AVLAEHLLVAGQLPRRAALRQAAAGLQVGQQHALVGVEDLGGLRHEVDAAEDDGRRLHGGGDAGQLQAVAGVVGQFLDFAVLVVVGEDGGVFAVLQARDFRQEVYHGRVSLFLVWRRNNPQEPQQRSA